MMKSISVACVGFAVIAMGLGGCAFNVSMHSKGSRAVLEGKDAIAVKAPQPALPIRKVMPPKPALKAKIVGKKIEITEKVMFDYDKATIKPESHGLLNDVAKVLKENPGITKIRVEGHTDSDGKAKYNKTLSEKRAAAVKEFLVSAGIEGGRITAAGYGMERPVAPNDSPEGKDKNRRVEFNILKGAKDAAAPQGN